MASAINMIVIVIAIDSVITSLPVQELLEEDIIETKLSEGEETEDKSPASSPVPRVRSSYLASYIRHEDFRSSVFLRHACTTPLVF